MLTEGWDHPPTSCVVLLRPSSYKSTMIQMVGRGLRTVNPEEHPGIIKTDCIVLDFGTSTLLHGSLEQDVDLDGHEANGEAPTKDLPVLRGGRAARRHRMPALRPRLGACRRGRRPRRSATSSCSEIDLLKRSSFQWCDLFGDDAALVANGFNAWGGIFFLNGRWYAVGGRQSDVRICLRSASACVCLAAADDWLNENETDESAHKSGAG